MTEAEALKRTAECACKRVSITVSGEPERCFACHCDYCQRLTGSVAITAALFKQENVLSIDGDYAVFNPELEEYPDARRYFCPNCASTVHWINPQTFPGMRLVSIGSFSDPSFKGPDAVFQTQYRHTWCPAFDAPESFEAYR